MINMKAWMHLMLRSARRCLIVTMFVIWAVTSQAAGEKESPEKPLNHAQGQAVLTSLLNSFTHYQAGFSQRVFDDKQQPIQEIQGNITLQKPHYFFWQTDEQQLKGNGQSIWFYEKDLAQVTIDRYAKQEALNPLLLIIKDTQAMFAQYHIVEWSQRNGLQVFTLAPKADSSWLKTMSLTFTAKHLTALQFTTPLDQRTQITLLNPKHGADKPVSFFTFVVPAGVDVVRND